MRICLFKVSEGMWGCLLFLSEEMWECLFSCLNGRKNFSLSFLKESMTFSLGCPAWCLVVVWWDSCSPPPRTAPGSQSANKHLNRFPPRYSQLKVTQRCPGSKNLYAMSLTALKQSSRCPKKKCFFIIISCIKTWITLIKTVLKNYSGILICSQPKILLRVYPYLRSNPLIMRYC